MEQFIRMQMLFGTDSTDILAQKKIAVFGVGGVGGFVAEALARSGIGTIELFDNDTVAVSNLNRQIVALHSTIGKAKVDIMAKRIQDINPCCTVLANNFFYTAENAYKFPLENYDFVVDAIDTVSSKLVLIELAKKANTPIICCMGTGNKLDPTQLKIDKIEKTSICPLARVMRIECRKRRLKNVMVLYSTEQPLKPFGLEPKKEGTIKQTPGSTAFVPAAAGLVLASYVVRKILDCY